MADKKTSATPLEQAQNGGGIQKLPSEYQYRLDDCELALARHRLIRDELKRGLTWTNISTGFDSALIALGGYFGWRNYRIAEEEASFVRAITGNPYIRRVFTPFPFFSLLCVMLGLFWLPVDLATISAAKERIAMQEAVIKNGETIRQDIIREGTGAASETKDVPIK